MTSKERYLSVLKKKIPDRLPVTTHHVMPCFLKKYMGNISYQEFYDYFGLDPVNWVVAQLPDTSAGHYNDPSQIELGFLELQRICSDSWQIKVGKIHNSEYHTSDYDFETQGGTLSMVLQSNDYTSWVSE